MLVTISNIKLNRWYFVLTCFLNVEILWKAVADQVPSKVVADLSLRGWTFYKADPRLNSASFLSNIDFDSRTGILHANTPSFCDIFSKQSHFYLHSLKIVHEKSLSFFRRVPVYQFLDRARCNISKDGNNISKHIKILSEGNSILLPRDLPVHSEIFRIADLFPSKVTPGNETKFILRETCSPGYLAINQKSGILHVARSLNTAAWWFPRGYRAFILAETGNKIIDKKPLKILVSNRRPKIKSFHKSVPKDSSRKSRTKRDLGAPSFPQSSYRESVREDAKIGSTVLTLTAQSSSGKIKYSMSSSFGNSRSERLFGIDSNTGVITVKEKLDRDEGDSRHDLSVRAALEKNIAIYDTTFVSIEITDVNDNAPVFEENSYKKVISESIPPGMEILQVIARDKDKDKNGEITYSIDNPGGVNSAFSIDPSYGTIRLHEQLDREVTPHYNLRIKAEDNGNPKKSSVTIVHIFLKDENDNFPQFSKYPYKISISEDTAPNSIIEIISATDKDADRNSKITYGLVGRYLTMFSIDPVKGDLRLKTSVDYENPRQRQFQLYVRASDGGLSPRMNQTRIIITVTDVNDNAPSFRSTSMTITIPEFPNTPVGSEIYTVFASDRDSKENGKIVYSLGTVPSSFPFVINPETGIISVTDQLDYEQNPIYRFEVVAKDKGYPSKESKANVIVRLQNINDNRPIFQKQKYEVNVTEDELPETSIIKVSAVDADQPSTHDFDYSISHGNDKTCFQIDSTGTVYLKCNLNFDIDKSFRLVIKVTDKSFVSSGTTLSSTALLIIKVTDANTHEPAFTQSVYTASVTEGDPVGTSVVKVSAQDKDTGENARITYSIIGNQGHFSINPDTGLIKTLKILDRETKSSYSLVVEAADHGTPYALQSQAYVTVRVRDVNDNPPVFTRSEYKVQIAESVPVGTQVAVVTATDKDVGVNKEVEYSMARNANGNGSFTVEKISGTIRTAKKLDRETIPNYDLIIVASDHGHSKRNSSIHVLVKLKDVKDSPPVFDPRYYNITIQENIPIGSDIVQVKATCADEGRNGNILYLIRSGSDRSFDIDMENGQIGIKAQMDYEKKRHYRLVIRALSGSWHDTANVDIYLTDLNDNAPDLLPFQVFMNVFKGQFPTGPLFKIPAEDKDVTSILRYAITSGGNEKDFVTLNPNTGMLSLKKTILNTASAVRIAFKVDDGNADHVRHSHGYITATVVTSEMVNNSIRIALNATSRDGFLTSSNIENFKVAFARAIGCDTRQVYLLSLEPFTSLKPAPGDNKVPKLQVSVAVRKTSGDGYFTAEELKNKLFLNRVAFVQKYLKNIISIDYGNEQFCSFETCSNYRKCSIEVAYKGSSTILSSKTVIFRGIDPRMQMKCTCPAGFRMLVTDYGQQLPCKVQYSLCYSKPCGKNGRCISTEERYKCFCNNGYAGRNCEINLKENQCPDDATNLCKNGGECQSSISGTGIGCRCSASSVPLTSSCELTGRYFPAHSFAAFPGLKNRWKLRISLEFATEVADGVLLYNGRYSEKKDFIAIRIHRGQAELVFSLGEDITIARSYVSGGVSDGRWQKITVVFEEKVGQIAVGENCNTQTLEMIKHRGSYTKHCLSVAESTESLRSLDVTAPMFIGGLPSTGATYRIPRTDFIGCIRNIYIDYNLTDFYSPLKEQNTQRGCPVKRDFCSSSPCTKGKCYNGIDGFRCICPDGYVGKKCQNDVRSTSKPVRFSKNGIIIPSNKQKGPPPPWTTSIVIRTRQSDAVLINEQINGSNGQLKLVSGYLTYFYNSIKLCNLSQVDVTDGKWHQIEVTWSANTVKLAADYGLHHVTKNHDLTISTQQQKLISLGGIMKGNAVEQGFEGCMQGVFFNGDKIVPLAGQTKNVESGCQTSDPCSSPGICNAHGTCKSNWVEKLCQCRPGYVGPNCDSICTLRPCKNRGTCVNSPTTTTGFTCQCKAIFTGEYCETKMTTECATGFYGKPGTGLCGPCKCALHKSFDPNCNKTTGVCHCKKEHYRVGEICEKCHCLDEGSLNNNCDRVTGQCRCKAKVTGLKCDRCIGAWEEITSNCIEINTSCPKSYAKEIWWQRGHLGQTKVQQCPGASKGNASRYCHRKNGWQEANLFDCTTNRFNNIRNTK